MERRDSNIQSRQVGNRRKQKPFGGQSGTLARSYLWQCVEGEKVENPARKKMGMRIMFRSSTFFFFCSF